MDDYVDVVHAQHLWGTVVLVDFSDGTRAVIDLSKIMRGPLYEDLLTTNQIPDFVVDSRLGTLVWPNGLDVAPDTLRESAILSSSIQAQSAHRAPLAIESPSASDPLTGAIRSMGTTSWIETLFRSRANALAEPRSGTHLYLPKENHPVLGHGTSFVYTVGMHSAEFELLPDIYHGVATEPLIHSPRWTDEDDEAFRSTKL